MFRTFALATLLIGLVMPTCGHAGDAIATNRQITDQDELDCKLVGFTAGMLADRRDNGMSREDAIRDAAENLGNLDVSTERSKHAVDNSMEMLVALADLAFGHPDHRPNTLTWAMPFVCISSKLHVRNKESAASFMSASTSFMAEALRCQANTPGIVPGFGMRKPEEVVRSCIEAKASMLMPPSLRD